MKRFHVHVSVQDLKQSIRFYSALFGAQPSLEKPDYAKWMLDDPRVNFAISTGAGKPGIDHLGLQAEEGAELEEIGSRLAQADVATSAQKGASCCYAKSDKYWTIDPQGVAWESFHTLDSVPMYGPDTRPLAQPMKKASRLLRMNVLFLCTGNSARSILAEAYLNHAGKGRFSAYSAGSKPGGKVNPFALELLKENGIPVASARSKSWDEFTRADAPRMDLVVTVCDNAAGEVCPLWPGAPRKAHWGVEDPAAVQGSDAEKRAAFQNAFDKLKRRIDSFLIA